jgi:hypothetical protein
MTTKNITETQAIQGIFTNLFSDEIHESSEIEIDDLSADEKKTLFAVMKFAKASRGTRDTPPTDIALFGGHHGRIATFKHGMGHWGGIAPRLFMDDLKKLTKLKIRWISFEKARLDVGF